MDLSKLLSFVDFTRQFRAIERQIALRDQERRENDMEHSYQLALAAWYLIDSRKLDLDANKAMRYALVHDLVEVYAGDTPLSSKDAELIASKAAREKDAEERIKKEFSEFPEMLEALHGYEIRLDKEAEFVYALDKLLPVLGTYIEGGHSWRVNNIDLDDIIRHKKDKIALSPELKVVFDEMVAILEKEKKDIFKKE